MNAIGVLEDCTGDPFNFCSWDAFKEFFAIFEADLLVSCEFVPLIGQQLMTR